MRLERRVRLGVAVFKDPAVVREAPVANLDFVGAGEDCARGSLFVPAPHGVLAYRSIGPAFAVEVVVSGSEAVADDTGVGGGEVERAMLALWLGAGCSVVEGVEDSFNEEVDPRRLRVKYTPSAWLRSRPG